MKFARVMLMANGATMLLLQNLVAVFRARAFSGAGASGQQDSSRTKP
jgi:hypothetical protein